MRSYNEVQLLGKLTQKSTLRFTPQGIAVLSFQISVLNKEQKEVSIFEIKAMGNLAEQLKTGFKVGDSLFIKGELKSRRYKKWGEGEVDKIEILSKEIRKIKED